VAIEMAIIASLRSMQLVLASPTVWATSTTQAGLFVSAGYSRSDPYHGAMFLNPLPLQAAE
jgi:hypothetical protein